MKHSSDKGSLFSRWSGWAGVNRGKTLLLALGLTLIAAWGISRLQMDMTFFSVMPDESQQVQDLDYILEEFPFASNIMVVIDGRGIADPEEAERQVKAAIDAMDEEFRKERYRPYIEEVYAVMDRSLMRERGLMLTETEDIRRFSRIYGDLNLIPWLEGLNNDFEREYSGNSDNLADDEEMAVSQFDGLSRLLALYAEAAAGRAVSDAQLEAAVDRFLFGQPYLLSRDNRMGIVMLMPTFTINDVGMLAKGIEPVDEKSGEIAARYGCEAGLTGLLVVGKDEMVTSEQGLAGSMLAAFVLILLLLVFAFRMVSVPVIAGIPLFFGIIWTAGVTGLVINRLNIMTAMYMVALLGLGIDYAVHILTGFVQEQDSGASFKAALTGAFGKSGPGILTGAVTTAAAFLVLMTAETDLMGELGFVAGAGILCELLAMFILLPVLLSYRDKRKRQKNRGERAFLHRFHIKSDLADGAGRAVAERPLAVVILLLAGGLLLTTQAGKVTIETNLMNMEAKGLTSVELQDVMVEEFEMAPDTVYIREPDPRRLKELSESLEDLATVKRVESLAPYLLLPEERIQREPLAAAFRERVSQARYRNGMAPEALLDELYRLEFNLIEMEDMAYMGQMEKLRARIAVMTGRSFDGEKVNKTSLDTLFAALESEETGPGSLRRLEQLQARLLPLLRQRLAAMATPGDVTLDMVPGMFRNSFVSADGSEYLLSVVPVQNPWEEENRSRFVTQIETVTDKSTGMIFAADQLTDMARTDGTRAAIFAVITIFFILLVDFRNLKLVVLTLVPLLLSFGSLFGLMAIFGIKFDFVNVIAVPLLIGIGIDDAVHINHRYLLEGPGGIRRTISKTGTAVLLTTLTTMIGFGSFIPSIMRAMRSTGIVLTMAMALAFIYSVLLHPALLSLLSERAGWNFEPWGRRAPRSGKTITEENHE